MGQTMTDSQAVELLLKNGISVATSGVRWSDGSVGDYRVGNDKRNKDHTSLEDMRYNTISQLIGFKKLSGCPIVVTGGTEVGHGCWGHANGYKVDIRLNDCIENFIKTSDRFLKPPQRKANGLLYTSTVGNEYLKEKDHWDIYYKPINK